MNNYAKTFSATKKNMQDNGSVFFNLEKTHNDYKDAVVTYQNRMAKLDLKSIFLALVS